MKKLIFFIILTVLQVHAKDIQYYTTSKDSFTGWDIYQNEYISFGFPNETSSISGYQHKIHDADGTFTDNLEYFCDPDDIIVIHSDFGKQKHYVSYLPVTKDLFLSNDKSQFRASFLTEIPLVNDLSGNPVKVKIEKSFGVNDNFINNKITFKNDTSSKTNIAWIAQDAAFMSFIDNNQTNVIPYSKISNNIVDKRFFSEINIGDEIGTQHKSIKNIGSYSPINMPEKCKVYGGVIDEYAFFATHISRKTTKDQYPYGYADVSRSSYNTLKNLKTYFKNRKFNNDNLKNRILLFECTNIGSREKFSIEYTQIGTSVSHISTTDHMSQ